MIPEFSTEEKLHERIKELTCLYDISLALLKSQSVEETLSEIILILKKAWLFFDDAVVELNYKGAKSYSGNLPKKTVFQEQNLVAYKEILGTLKVHYPATKYVQEHFLEDEQRLLDMACMEIGIFLEKNIAASKEAKLKRSMERVDRLSILGEITAGIAHELNTPLGNILGFAELINEHNSDKQTANDISKIINAAIYSREIVKKLMFFSCEMPQYIKLVKIRPIFEEALSLLGPSFKKAGISYEMQFENNDLEAQIDTIQLTQVLFNILINSVYASPQDSLLSIEVNSDSKNFYIKISDEGSGIPEAIKPKIFEPFFTTKPVGDGSGLGLSVVHGIIKSHKGDIIATDNLPKGTIFTIRLPLNSL